VLSFTDFLVNGAGFCRRLEERAGDVPLIRRLLRDLLEEEEDDPLQDFLSGRTYAVVRTLATAASCGMGTNSSTASWTGVSASHSLRFSTMAVFSAVSTADSKAPASGTGRPFRRSRTPRRNEIRWGGRTIRGRTRVPVARRDALVPCRASILDLERPRGILEQACSAVPGEMPKFASTFRLARSPLEVREALLGA